GGSDMGLATEILRIILPIAIVGGISVFVILRMKHKYNNGTLGKKKSKNAQILLDCLIPFGMMAGLFVSVFLSLFTSIPLLSTIAWGPGIGFLFGYIAYEIYSRKGESSP